MTPAIHEAIVALTSSLAASIIAKATAVVLLALAGIWLTRANSASVRHAVLAAGFAVLLALPIVCIVSPPIRVTVPIAGHHPNVTTRLAQYSETSPAKAGMGAAASSDGSTEGEVSSMELLFGAWIIGAAIFLAPVLIGLWQVRSLRRTALPWPRGKSLATNLAHEAGLRRTVEVMLHESMHGPVTCGVVRPAIFMPLDAENWSDEDLSRAARHEFEHVRRADWLTQCGTRILCAVYWFHPLIWVAQRRLLLEAERACDDAVLVGCEATAYAEQLVGLARRLLRPAKSPVLAMASRSDLAARVSAVLDGSQRRGRIGALVAVPVAIAAIFIITMSPIELIAAPQSVANQTAPPLTFEVASVKPHKPGDRPAFPEFLAGGRFTEAGVPLQIVIATAYSLPFQGTQISGGPDWIRTFGEAYDIDARAEDGAMKGLSAEQQDQKAHLMLQALLADRFGLVIHREMKEQAVYILTLAKKGPKLQKSKLDQQVCADPTALCGAGTVGQGRGIHLKATTVADMAFQVNNYTDRPLLDRTGLTGLYDIDTSGWVPMRGGPRTAAAQPPSGPEAEAMADPSRPTLFMIFDELGLKMEASQAPVESFEIEHVERPTAN